MNKRRTGKRSTATTEPPVVRLDPSDPAVASAPRDLDEHGVEFWRSVMIDRETTARPVDLLLLGTACRWYSLLRSLQSRLATDPSDYKATTAAAVASKHFATYAAKLAVGPIDRLKIGDTGPHEPDALDLLRMGAEE